MTVPMEVAMEVLMDLPMERLLCLLLGRYQMDLLIPIGTHILDLDHRTVRTTIFVVMAMDHHK